MKANTLIWIILLVVVIALGMFFLYGGNEINSPEASNAGQIENTETGIEKIGGSVSDKSNGSTVTQESGSVVVEYTDGGFSPKTLTITKGQTIQFVNKSRYGMWVASSIHPTHEVYNGTTLREHCSSSSDNAFDQCSTGNDYSFTFNKKGRWGYHNHTLASDTGVITVME